VLYSTECVGPPPALSAGPAHPYRGHFTRQAAFKSPEVAIVGPTVAKTMKTKPSHKAHSQKFPITKPHEIGEPVRRVEVVPTRHPVVAPEPKTPAPGWQPIQVPLREKEPA
jgi:hypothetical protein